MAVPTPAPAVRDDVPEGAPGGPPGGVAGAATAAGGPSAAQDERRRAFLRLVSHELRTPLNAIIGFSEIISRELHGPINEPKYRDHAEMIHQSGRKLLHLVNQVLEIARLEAGVADLAPGAEPVDALLARAARGASAEAAAKGVTLTVTVPSDVACVWADERALQTALAALVQNAVAFSPPGAEVSLRAEREGDRVALLVQDRGPGLDQADMTRLMRPFEQGEHALIRRGEGAGLGLPIARLLSQAMGGTLRLSPREGGGLTAAIRLPIP